jgi:tRNA threonylcarbamoyladenosine biosynthesis protein TsaE
VSGQIDLDLPDEQATAALGEALARALPGGTPALLLALRGELGAGKSTLARALLRALGVQGPIRSPTYTLIEPYATQRGDCLHLDLYRLGDPAELDYLGLDEQYPSTALWIVEWPEQGGDRLPPIDLDLNLLHARSGRSALLRPMTERGHRWCRTAGISSS